jgi:phosphate transport system substrate-binding protein
MTSKLFVAALAATAFLGIEGALDSASAQVKPPIDQQIAAYQPAAKASGLLAIAGSDTMRPIVEAWAGDLQRRHEGLKFKIEAAGSETGLAALLDHRAQVAAMTRRMTAAEIAEFVKEYGYEPAEVPVAVDALAVFVHKDNPIAGLSLDELDSIFCNQRRRGLPYAAIEWGLVGLTDEWFTEPIRPYGRNGSSGTSQFFREEVCQGGTFRSHLVKAAGSAAVVLDIERDRLGIGFSAIGYKTSGVRAIPVAAVKGGRYVDPTFESALDGSYPLRRHLYLYMDQNPKAPPSPSLTELVRFAISAQGQQIVVDQGYYPLPISDISRLLRKWTLVPVKAAEAFAPRPLALN